MAAGALISVVVSTLNRPVLLGRCLRALADGTRPPDEVIVVNQGTAEPVEAVVREAVARGLPVTHLPHSGRGLSASQNAGVAEASGDVVAIVDDDCVPAPTWVEVVAQIFGATTPPDLLGGRILSLPPEGDRVVAVSSRTREVALEARWPELPWRIGSGGNYAVWRARYLEVGGNDERLGTGAPGQAGNDIDLFYRLLRAGCVARYEPALLVHHERATLSERRSRRGSYGFGIGACVGLWLRGGDRWAWHALAVWVAHRARLVRRRRTAGALEEEVMVLIGTLRGLWFGLRRRPRPLLRER